MVARVKKTTTSGSYNIEISGTHKLLSYRIFIAGHSNTISGAYIPVTRGSNKNARKLYSIVTSDNGNEVIGEGSAVSRGSSNTANGK